MNTSEKLFLAFIIVGVLTVITLFIILITKLISITDKLPDDEILSDNEILSNKDEGRKTCKRNKVHICENIGMEDAGDKCKSSYQVGETNLGSKLCEEGKKQVKNGMGCTDITNKKICNQSFAKAADSFFGIDTKDREFKECKWYDEGDLTGCQEHRSCDGDHLKYFDCKVGWEFPHSSVCRRGDRCNISSINSS